MNEFEVVILAKECDKIYKKLRNANLQRTVTEEEFNKLIKILDMLIREFSDVKEAKERLELIKLDAELTWRTIRGIQ